MLVIVIEAVHECRWILGGIAIGDFFKSLLVMLNLDQIYFCARECRRQQSGEISVARMASALMYASQVPISLSSVLEVGRRVDPCNESGVRKVPVTFLSGEVLPSNNLAHALDQLITEGTDLDPDAFYQYFEMIHPFVDGNGRVGAILFNKLNDTLRYPVVPPEFSRSQVNNYRTTASL